MTKFRAPAWQGRNPLGWAGVVLLAFIGCRSVLAEPVDYSDASVAQGGELYRLHCTQCHGADGRAQLDVIADATDLTEPELYRNGSSLEDVYRSINEGAGVAMPAWGPQLSDADQLGHLVNFVLSLWPEAERNEALGSGQR